MCRLLMVKSQTKILPNKLLLRFAKMCQKSRTMEGFEHGDGWGISWLIQKSQSRKIWFSYHSLKPIWQDQEMFTNFPQTRIFLVHARSASFLSQRNILEYNQPFVDEQYGFVFNGMLKGVALPLSVPGKIGSQKIKSLLIANLSANQPVDALARLYTALKSGTREMKGCNIGFSDGNMLFAVCGVNVNAHHFQLQKYISSDLKIICSEQIGPYPMANFRAEEVLAV